MTEVCRPISMHTPRMGARVHRSHPQSYYAHKFNFNAGNFSNWGASCDDRPPQRSLTSAKAGAGGVVEPRGIHLQQHTKTHRQRQVAIGVNFLPVCKCALCYANLCERETSFLCGCDHITISLYMVASCGAGMLFGSVWAGQTERARESRGNSECEMRCDRNSNMLFVCLFRVRTTNYSPASSVSRVRPRWWFPFHPVCGHVQEIRTQHIHAHNTHINSNIWTHIGICAAAVLGTERESGFCYIFLCVRRQIRICRTPLFRPAAAPRPAREPQTRTHESRGPHNAAAIFLRACAQPRGMRPE